MGKISTKQNKSAYQLEREKLHLTRAEAADKMSAYGMTEHRLVRIEDGTSNVEPEDVYAMSKAYNAPHILSGLYIELLIRKLKIDVYLLPSNKSRILIGKLSMSVFKAPIVPKTLSVDGIMFNFS